MQITCPTHPTPGDIGSGNRNKVFSICLAYLVSLVNLVCLVYLIENVWKVENVVNILLRGILFLKAGYQILPAVLPF
jgi:hypothetical protein